MSSTTMNSNMVHGDVSAGFEKEENIRTLLKRIYPVDIKEVIAVQPEEVRWTNFLHQRGLA